MHQQIIPAQNFATAALPASTEIPRIGDATIALKDDTVQEVIHVLLVKTAITILNMMDVRHVLLDGMVYPSRQTVSSVMLALPGDGVRQMVEVPTIRAKHVLLDATASCPV